MVAKNRLDSYVNTWIYLEDERSIANRLAREERREDEEGEKSLQKKQIDIDPTLPVSSTDPVP